MRRVCWEGIHVVSTLVPKISSILFSLLISRSTVTRDNFLTGWMLVDRRAGGGGAVQTASRVEERPHKIY